MDHAERGVRILSLSLPQATIQSAALQPDAWSHKSRRTPQRPGRAGYDDALLTRANDSEPDVPKDDLAQMRALVPRRDNPEALCGGRQTQLAWREPQALAELVGQTAPNQPCHV